MDQLKKQLAVVLQYGFWIGTATVLLGTVGSWYMTTGELDRQNESQIRDIKSNVGKVDQLRGELPEQPNDFSHEKMRGMIDARKREVLSAWKSIYENQRGILTWPSELQKSFTDEFSLVRDETTGQYDVNRQKLPFEVYVDYPTPPEQQAAPTMRRRYQLYISDILPKIAAIAHTEWTADFDAGPAAAGMGMGMDDMGMGMNMASTTAGGGLGDGPLVVWSKSSQEAVLTDLFPWRGKRPTTLDVYYSQENLWILKQLLQIIDKVNGDARQPFEAKIREIKRLAIGGKSAQFGAGSIAQPGVRGGGMMDEMSSMDMGGGMEMGGSGMDMGGGNMQEATDPGDNRYLNTEEKPISGSALRSALKSKTPGDAPLAVAKRVPVMLSVIMDQRHIHELLAQCGSAALMVEVKQCRVLPKGATGAVAGGGGDMGMDMGESMGDDMGMGGMGGSSMGGTSMGGTQKSADEYPLDMQVEIYGLIYLYNPPDEEALGIEQVTQDTVVGGETVGSAAAKPTPVVPTPDADLPAPSTDTPSTDTPSTDTPSTDTPSTDTPSPDTPSPDVPAATEPTGPIPPAAATPADGVATPPAGPTAIAVPN